MDKYGSGTLERLAEGTYYLKNIRAAVGYKLTDIVMSDANSSSCVSWLTDVVVSPVSSLPFAGGIGTIIYTAIGLIVIVSSVALFYVYRKRQDRELS